ncbi:MAG: hypothetical protein F6K50_46920 [Moorea sp. SIO3I7]|uniref:hypothetical protein n=1 Tax=Moorena TaxID=1155738 RepID=UPI001301868D|nr:MULTISPECIES: hypothetical protein [Moorena]NEO02614.1 hypothetical protein [Moorena sp. SIO3I7]NEO15582.1 hypothetical protein [Moorena sp. SIO3E8]NEQ00996.1 hypothetical protein [Moorena sp. SIO3F7]
MVYSRLPTPDSRFPTPDSRLPIPDSRFPIPCSLNIFSTENAKYIYRNDFLSSINGNPNAGIRTTTTSPGYSQPDGR